MNKLHHIYISISETFLIFKIEKKKTKKLFFCGETTVNPLRKKPRTGKTQIALLGHAPGFRSARENACPIGAELTVTGFSQLIFVPNVAISPLDFFYFSSPFRV